MSGPRLLPFPAKGRIFYCAPALMIATHLAPKIASSGAAMSNVLRRRSWVHVTLSDKTLMPFGTAIDGGAAILTKAVLRWRRVRGTIRDDGTGTTGQGRPGT